MNIKKFKNSVAQKKKTLIRFLDKLDDIVPEDMPALVARQDAAVWKEVKCTECANCCKTMTPTFSKTDIDRISRHLEISRKEFRNRWLRKEKESGDYVNISQPCQFLVDNKCSIYEVRPADCAEFPHHDKQPFDDYNETFKTNLPYCPATFTLIYRLQKIVERDYEWPAD